MNIQNENDMLRGNICRMNVTDSIEELEEMYYQAFLKLFKIYDAKRRYLKEKNTESEGEE